MLVEPITKLLQSAERPEVTPEIEGWIEAAGEEMKKSFRRQFVSQGEERKEPSASSLGKCARQLAYKYHGVKGEPISPRARIVFATGDYYEVLAKLLLRLAGVPIRNEQAGVRLPSGVGGSIDFTAELSDVESENPVVDVKSHSSFGFERESKEGISDSFGYRTQGAIYREGMGRRRFLHLNFNKNTGEFAEVEDTGAVSPLVRNAERRYKLVKESTPDKLPAREYEPLREKDGRPYLDFTCAYCPFKSTCWTIEERRQMKGTYVREYVSPDA